MSPGILSRLFAAQQTPQAPDQDVQWGPNPYPQMQSGPPATPTPLRMATDPPGPMAQLYQEPSWGQGFIGPRPSGFVDQIDEGVAQIMGDDGNMMPVDANNLPPGAEEGSWVRDRQVIPAPPSRGDAIRKRLSAGDNGGPIKL